MAIPFPPAHLRSEQVRAGVHGQAAVLRRRIVQMDEHGYWRVLLVLTTHNQENTSETKSELNPDESKEQSYKT